jgi:hypothetical protein
VVQGRAAYPTVHVMPSCLSPNKAAVPGGPWSQKTPRSQSTGAGVDICSLPHTCLSALGNPRCGSPACGKHVTRFRSARLVFEAHILVQVTTKQERNEACQLAGVTFPARFGGVRQCEDLARAYSHPARIVHARTRIRDQADLRRARLVLSIGPPFRRSSTEPSVSAERCSR